MVGLVLVAMGYMGIPGGVTLGDLENEYKQQHATSISSPIDVASSKARTYSEIGRDNGFTREQWDKFYDEMEGFSLVNGIRVRDYKSSSHLDENRFLGNREVDKV